jgi:hypothetical protein
MFADIVAQDANGSDVLIGVVSTMPLSPAVVAEYFEIIDSECPSIPFCMIVDRDTIRLKKKEFEPRSEVELVFDLKEVLRPYDPEFGTKRVAHFYLRTLIEAWLRDLSYHWKLEDPPKSDELAAIGLMPLLNGGTTQSEVPLGADALR